VFGLIGKITAEPGQREALMAVLLAGMRDLPGCLSYVVARDTNDDDALWVTEAWRSREAHRASLERPEVRDAIARGRPLIRAFETRIETEPVGGHGLADGDGGAAAGGAPTDADPGVG
jgi:quinol monooxygenase YgiN